MRTCTYVCARAQCLRVLVFLHICIISLKHAPLQKKSYFLNNFLENSRFLLLVLYCTHIYLYCNGTRLCTHDVTHNSSRPHWTLCALAILSANGIWYKFVFRLCLKKTDLILLNNFIQSWYMSTHKNLKTTKQIIVRHHIGKLCWTLSQYFSLD